MEPKEGMFYMQASNTGMTLKGKLERIRQDCGRRRRLSFHHNITESL
jgi:hypothetical protein